MFAIFAKIAYIFKYQQQLKKKKIISDVHYCITYMHINFQQN